MVGSAGVGSTTLLGAGDSPNVVTRLVPLLLVIARHEVKSM
jgi:hypothetical protein